MPRKSASNVVSITAASSVDPDPTPVQGMRAQRPHQTDATGYNRRYTSMLDCSKDAMTGQWIRSSVPLRVIASKYQIETIAAENIIRETLNRWFNERSKRAA